MKVPILQTPARKAFPQASVGDPSWPLMTPLLAMLAVFYMAPLLSVLWTSVSVPSLGLGNYAQLIGSEAIRRVIWTTMRICALTTVVSVLLAYVIAYLLHQAPPFRRSVMMTMIVIPLWVSVLARTFAWLTLLRGEGLVNTALIDLGLVDEPLALVRNEFGVCLGMIHYMVPYAVLPILTSMESIDARLTAASRSMGASATRTFWRIFLPLSLPGVAGAVVIVFILALGFYITPAVLGGGRTVMMAEYVSIQVQQTTNWGLATALAATLLAIVFVLLLALSRFVDVDRLFGAGR